MTSYFVEKSKWVVFDDISVIVDNSVEIGDFFVFTHFVDEGVEVN